MKINIVEILASTLDTKEKIKQLVALRHDLNGLSAGDIIDFDNELKGRYGAEYILNGDDYTYIIDFYEMLLQLNPVLIELEFSLADLYLLSGDECKAVACFLGLYYRRPELIYDSPGELSSIIASRGGIEYVKYRIALIRALVRDSDFESAKDELGKLQEDSQGAEDVRELLHYPEVNADVSLIQ